MTNREVLRLPQNGRAALACPAASGFNGQEWEYMHHTPGRLRVRTAALQRNPDRADAIEKTVKGIRGVSAAAANLLTGSLTVIYEPGRVTPEEILDVLRSQGLHAVPRRRNAANTAADSAVQKAGRAVLYIALEKVLEHSVKAALTALL